MKWHLPTSSSHLVRHWYSFIDSPSAFILSLLLCLCICMLFICMMQCWSFALITYCWCVTQMHTSFFFLGHTVCLVTSVGLVQRPLKAMSGIFPPPSFFSLFSFSLPLSLALLLSTASSLEKASPLPEGRSRSLRSNRSYSGSSVAVVKMTPLSFIPGAKIIKYLGIINMFFIRETSSLREVTVSLFLDSFRSRTLRHLIIINILIIIQLMLSILIILIMQLKIIQSEFQKCWDVFLNLKKMKTKKTFKSHKPIFYSH